MMLRFFHLDIHFERSFLVLEYSQYRNDCRSLQSVNKNLIFASQFEKVNATMNTLSHLDWNTMSMATARKFYRLIPSRFMRTCPAIPYYQWSLHISLSTRKQCHAEPLDEMLKHQGNFWPVERLSWKTIAPPDRKQNTVRAVLSQEPIRLSHVLQILSRANFAPTQGPVERQNWTLILLFSAYCFRR